MRLDPDERGLHYECDLPGTQAGRDLKESLKRGDISGSTFAFNLAPGDDEFSEEEDKDRNRIVVRTIRNFSALHDVSPITCPQYAGTGVALDERSLVVAQEVRSFVERLLGPAAPTKTTIEKWARRQIDHRVRNERLALIEDLQVYPRWRPVQQIQEGSGTMKVNVKDLNLLIQEYSTLSEVRKWNPQGRATAVRCDP